MNLNNAIGKEQFNIDGNSYTDDDLQGMKTDELETLKIRISKKISSLSIAIKEKQIDYAGEGKRTSKEWYINRKLALYINQHALTYVNSLIKKRRRAERSISDFFMNSAKSILPLQDYQLILNDAHKEKEAREGIL
jgi:hypothetical protein